MRKQLSDAEVKHQLTVSVCSPRENCQHANSSSASCKAVVDLVAV